MKKLRYRNIGITGAEGDIGTILRKGLTNTYKITSFTQTPVDFPSNVVDLSRQNEVEGKFAGLDAVIHLAADRRPAALWESVRENNVEATYQVFEECKRSGVKRLVFASTNHTQHGNTIVTTPESLDTTKSFETAYSESGFG